MRTLLAIVMFAGSIFALNSTADAGRGYRRGPKVPCYAVPRRPVPCTRGAWWSYSPYDPAGEFQGYPGWARKRFNNLCN